MTRRDDAPAESTHAFVRLPGVLADRYSVVAELAAQGAEADLLRVEDAAGTGFVVKLFRRGFTADREVWRKLPELESAAIVRIHETGHADGRDYEVLEYVPNGNLRALLQRGGDTYPAQSGPRAGAGPSAARAHGLPANVVSEVVRQLIDGLTCLHEAGIVHRDLKPENVLVRHIDPIEVTITDFGLSKAIEESVVFASSSRTLAYAAPESLSGQVSPARDWWSLGVIARELSTGNRPFEGMTETAVVDHLATRRIDVDDVDDERMKLLCRGLLTRDPRQRWGADQVRGWLAGESPPVAAEPDSAPARRGLPFLGRMYRDRRELARALVANWQGAAHRFFAGTRDGTGPREAWLTLRDWLAQFDDPDRDDVEGRIELVDVHLTGRLPADVKLLHLVRWLDPALPPHLLGRRVLPEDLPALVDIAKDDGSPDHETARRIARALWKHRLLPLLATSPGGTALGEIDAHWRQLAQAWDGLAGWARGRLPEAAHLLPEAGSKADDPPFVLLDLLALAAAPDAVQAELAETAARARALVTEPVDWFDRYAAETGHHPLRLLALIRVSTQAAVHAEAARQRRAAAERAAVERRRHWQDAESRRLAGRSAAVRRSMLYTALILPGWLLGSMIVAQLSPVGDSESNGTFLITMVVTAGLVGLTQMGIEALLARRQGSDYAPGGPWSMLAGVLDRTGRGLGGLRRRIGASYIRIGPVGCGCLVLIAAPVALFVISAAMVLAVPVWVLCMLVTPIVHAIVGIVRLKRWQRAHEQARTEALGGS